MDGWVCTGIGRPIDESRSGRIRGNHEFAHPRHELGKTCERVGTLSFQHAGHRGLEATSGESGDGRLGQDRHESLR